MIKIDVDTKRVEKYLHKIMMKTFFTRWERIKLWFMRIIFPSKVEKIGNPGDVWASHIEKEAKQFLKVLNKNPVLKDNHVELKFKKI